jgi:hypothetical protein
MAQVVVDSTISDVNYGDSRFLVFSFLLLAAPIISKKHGISYNYAYVSFLFVNRNIFLSSFIPWSTTFRTRFRLVNEYYAMCRPIRPHTAFFDPINATLTGYANPSTPFS